MENLNERAANYAAEKTNELLTKAIAQAYADGYRDGFKERESESSSFEESHDVKFIDLGLPSGTKWSTKLMGEDDFADYFAYADAASYGLPTIEQVEELANYCRWQRDFKGQTFYGATCIGKNGKEIYIRSWGYKEGDRLCCYGYGADTIFFWIRNEEEGDEMKAIKLNNVKDEKPEFEIVKLFSGYKLPVMLVSNK
jgi:hypothetical protein